MLRQQFKANFDQGIITTPHLAFNWTIVQMIIPVNCRLVTISKREIIRSAAPNLTLYVRGEGIVKNSEGLTIDNRVPGLFSGYRPNHPQGVSTVIALTELELWCCNRKENKGKLPNLSPIILDAGDTLNLPLNSKILICSGKLDEYAAGDSFILSKSMNAKEKVYALLFN
jgi:hypothetical protein